MNYDNYERKIVETYSITLDGFPLGTVQNPGKIGRRESLIQLLDSLIGTSCSWVKLTDSERAERMKNNLERQAKGEQVYKARKCCAKEANTKSKEIVNDDDDDNNGDNGDNGDNSNEEQPSQIDDEAGEE